MFHGSSTIIEKPGPDYSIDSKLYHHGFLLTDDGEATSGRACSSISSGFINRYLPDLSDLRILDLTSEEYCILHWMYLLVENRTFCGNTSVMRKGMEHIIKHFRVNSTDYDVIVSYRTDGSHFSIARAFLNNQIQ